MRLGVFGGEFDPPHVGHVVICQEARFRLGLDRLMVVPAGTPPHRPASDTPPEVRHMMAAAAFAGEADTEVSGIEMERSGPSYTVDTLEELAGPEVELYLVMGADQFAGFGGWHRPNRIRELATIAVAGRPGSDPPDGADVLIPSPLMELSSTELRRRVTAGEPIRHLVSDRVLRIVVSEGLYL